MESHLSTSQLTPQVGPASENESARKIGVIDVNSLRGVRAGPRKWDEVGPASENESARKIGSRRCEQFREVLRMRGSARAHRCRMHLCFAQTQHSRCHMHAQREVANCLRPLNKRQGMSVRAGPRRLSELGPPKTRICEILGGVRAGPTSWENNTRHCLWASARTHCLWASARTSSQQRCK